MGKLKKMVFSSAKKKRSSQCHLLLTESTVQRSRSVYSHARFESFRVSQRGRRQQNPAVKKSIKVQFRTDSSSGTAMSAAARPLLCLWRKTAPTILVWDAEVMKIDTTLAARHDCDNDQDTKALQMKFLRGDPEVTGWKGRRLVWRSVLSETPNRSLRPADVGRGRCCCCWNHPYTTKDSSLAPGKNRPAKTAAYSPNCMFFHTILIAYLFLALEYEIETSLVNTRVSKKCRKKLFRTRRRRRPVLTVGCSLSTPAVNNDFLVCGDPCCCCFCGSCRCFFFPTFLYLSPTPTEKERERGVGFLTSRDDPDNKKTTAELLLRSRSRTSSHNRRSKYPQQQGISMGPARIFFRRNYA